MSSVLRIMLQRNYLLLIVRLFNDTKQQDALKFVVTRFNNTCR